MIRRIFFCSRQLSLKTRSRRRSVPGIRRGNSMFYPARAQMDPAGIGA